VLAFVCVGILQFRLTTEHRIDGRCDLNKINAKIDAFTTEDSTNIAVQLRAARKDGPNAASTAPSIIYGIPSLQHTPQRTRAGKAPEQVRHPVRYLIGPDLLLGSMEKYIVE